MPKFTATYSPEDNKLRLYVENNERLDEETYAKVKEAGFTYAPIQKLFVAGRWTPKREDLCIELAGEIHAEESTMAERAVAKAARLDNLRAKNEDNADAFSQAAHRIADRMVAGQPILRGHHSQRKAERDVQKMKAAQERAEKCADAIRYWGWKAEGVERHANRKNNAAVRSRRIDTLLAELRDHQRDLNHGYLVFELWSMIDQTQDPERRHKLADHYVGAHLHTGSASGSDTYTKVRNGEMTLDEAIQRGLEYGEALMGSEYASRWVNHILNRLAYEREEMPPTELYDGVLTAATLQTFARSQGAHKPEAQRGDDKDTWTLKSIVPFPCQMGDGLELKMSSEAWCELMQGCGYSVPAAKTVPPILNFRIAEGQGLPVSMYRSETYYPQVEMTKEAFNGCIRLHSSGLFRFRVTSLRGSYKQVAVFLTDSKEHKAPENCERLTVQLDEGAAA